MINPNIDVFCENFKEISLEMIKRYVFKDQQLLCNQNSAKDYLYDLCLKNTLENPDSKLKEKINLPKHDLEQYIRNNIFSIFSVLEEANRDNLILFGTPEHRDAKMLTVQHNAMMEMARQQVLFNCIEEFRTFAEDDTILGTGISFYNMENLELLPSVASLYRFVWSFSHRDIESFATICRRVEEQCMQSTNDDSSSFSEAFQSFCSERLYSKKDFWWTSDNFQLLVYNIVYDDTWTIEFFESLCETMILPPRRSNYDHFFRFDMFGYPREQGLLDEFREADRQLLLQQMRQQEQEENNFANENNENNNANLTIVDGNEVYTNSTCDL